MIEPFTLAMMAIRLSALSKSFAIPMVTGLEPNPLANREQAVLNQDTIVERPLSFRMQNTTAHQNKCIMIWIQSYLINVILVTKEKAFRWLNAFSTMEQQGMLSY